MATRQAESSLTPQSPMSSFTAFALLAMCFAGLVVVASCDSQSPTAPDPVSSSSSSSTAGSTTSSSTTVPTSTTSSSTTSVNNTQLCQEELSTLASGTTTWRNVILQGYCVSPTRGRPALFSHFRLSQASDVTIDMASSEFDTFLTLRSGRSTSGSHLRQNDDGGLGTNSRIVTQLDAGEYTIEQGVFNALSGPSAVFTRTISVSPGSGTSTSSSTTSRRTTSRATTSRRTTSRATTSRRTTSRATTSRANLNVEWTLEDSCYDSRPIQYRFFQADSSRRRTGREWPGGTLRDGERATDLLRLDRSGQWACFGAETRYSDGRVRSWGLGIDGSRGCNDCCGAEGGSYGFRLTC